MFEVYRNSWNIGLCDSQLTRFSITEILLGIFRFSNIHNPDNWIVRKISAPHRHRNAQSRDCCYWLDRVFAGQSALDRCMLRPFRCYEIHIIFFSFILIITPLSITFIRIVDAGCVFVFVCVWRLRWPIVMASEGPFCCAFSRVFDDHVARFSARTFFFAWCFLLYRSKRCVRARIHLFHLLCISIILVIIFTRSLIANNTCFGCSFVDGHNIGERFRCFGRYAAALAFTIYPTSNQTLFQQQQQRWSDFQNNDRIRFDRWCSPSFSSALSGACSGTLLFVSI